MRIAILKTQGASHSPNIRLVIPFTSFTPSELASPTLLNSDIMPNFKIALQSYRNHYNYRTITMRVNPHANLEVLPLTLILNKKFLNKKTLT